MTPDEASFKGLIVCGRSASLVRWKCSRPEGARKLTAARRRNARLLCQPMTQFANRGCIWPEMFRGPLGFIGRGP